MKMLAVDHFRCTGCRLCEIACSTRHDGAANPAAARLAVVRWEEEGIHVPTTCRQCDVAMCGEVCQPKAIHRDSGTGALLVDYGRCIGCRMCVMGCPYGAMSVHPVDRQVIKCTLCDGDPQCVRFCETGALRFVEPEMVAAAKRTATAETLLRGER
ncbi:MAG: 4Fe-4S dicluster domain-containing protein [Candidatus Binatia bacterium]